MKNRRWVFYISLIILVVLSVSGAPLKNKANLNGNDDDSIKKSIAYFHKDYVSDSKSINIIDEFNYDVNKVVMFNYEQSIGYAKFDKDHQGDFKIFFVETYNKNNEREISK